MKEDYGTIPLDSKMQKMTSSSRCRHETTRELLLRYQATFDTA